MRELSFVVDSALLSELGERLVETVHLALAELIKNAYDADATEVEVMVLPDRKGKSIISVSDDGVGMTFADVQNYWMRIATTIKVKEQVSPRYGRSKTGSKGIGRFSCRRLGSELELMTTGRRKEGKYETTRVEFDWDKYKPGTDVTQITCPGETRTAKESEAGTKLIIRGGEYGEWNQRSWNTLKRRMVVLVANRGVKRRGFEEDPGFNIKLASPDFEDEVFVNTREQLMEAGWGTLKITVEKDGTLKCSLKAKKIGDRSYTYKRAYPTLAGTTAEIAILPYYEKGQLRDTRLLSLGNLRKILPEWGGVYIRQRGFRVYPFGRPGDDWLYIERDRARRLGQSEYDVLRGLAERLVGVDRGRELLNMLSSHSYVGSVEVASPDPLLFEMKASREGFVGEDGVRLLRKAVRFGIDWSTIYRDYYIRLVGKEKVETKRREFQEAAKVRTEPEKAVETAVDYVKQEVGQLAGKLPRVERQALSKAIDVILQSDMAKGEELRHLRLVASTSSLLLVFAHEVRALLGDLDHYVTALGTIAKQAGGAAAQKAREMQAEINERKQRFRDLLGMASLISVDSKKAKPEALALRDKVEKAVKCYKLVVDGYDIDIDYDGIPMQLKTGKMLEAELYSILLNILSNAIKAVVARGGTKKIAIKADKVVEGTRMNVLDAGVGVKMGSSEDLFVPFVADPEGMMYHLLEKRMNPEDEYIMGTGSGLGLSIVREIVRARGGNVTFRPAKGEWRTNLEVILP
ncbi:MAG: ATP-binding protein [Desulfobacteraceae bacterium]|nr:ATP-binding protein [Desulfobacteraceae bacterium]